MGIRSLPDYCKSCGVLTALTAQYPPDSFLETRRYPKGVCPALAYAALRAVTVANVFELVQEITPDKTPGAVLKDITLESNAELVRFEKGVVNNANSLAAKARQCSNRVQAGNLSMTRSIDVYKLMELEVKPALQSFESGLKRQSSLEDT